MDRKRPGSLSEVHHLYLQEKPRDMIGMAVRYEDCADIGMIQLQAEERGRKAFTGIELIELVTGI